MLAVVTHEVFPFLRRLGGDGFTYSHHMRDARFTIPTAQLLSRVVDALRAARHRTLTLLDELTQSAFAAIWSVPEKVEARDLCRELIDVSVS